MNEDKTFETLCDKLQIYTRGHCPEYVERVEGALKTVRDIVIDTDLFLNRYNELCQRFQDKEIPSADLVMMAADYISSTGPIIYNNTAFTSVRHTD